MIGAALLICFLLVLCREKRDPNQVNFLGALVSGIFSSIAGSKSRKFAAVQNATKIQTAVADAKAAGINPVTAVTSGAGNVTAQPNYGNLASAAAIGGLIQSAEELAEEKRANKESERLAQAELDVRSLEKQAAGGAGGVVQATSNKANPETFQDELTSYAISDPVTPTPTQLPAPMPNYATPGGTIPLNPNTITHKSATGENTFQGPSSTDPSFDRKSTDDLPTPKVGLTAQKVLNPKTIVVRAPDTINSDVTEQSRGEIGGFMSSIYNYKQDLKYAGYHKNILAQYGQAAANEMAAIIQQNPEMRYIDAYNTVTKRYARNTRPPLKNLTNSSRFLKKYD